MHSATPPFESPPASIFVVIGRFFFKWRNSTFPVFFLAIAVLARPVLFDGSLRSDLWLDAFGMSIAAFGQLIRCVTVGLDYIKRGGKKKRVYADRLVTGGVFAHCRNPLYVGNILQVLGLVVIHNSIWMYAAVLPAFVFIYVCIVAAEEQFLLEKFSDEYTLYCQRVSRWWISPFGWLRTLNFSQFDWLKLVRKEYGTPVSWISNALALMGWEAIRNAGFAANRDRLLILLLCWLPVGTFWIVARMLKKNGSLGADASTTV